MVLKGKRIVVTGADGFIGSHLVEALIRENPAHIRALSYYNSFNHWGWLEDVSCKNEIEIISGDIRDPFFCNRLLKNADVVFHLAALIGIPYSYIAPSEYIDTNVKGTLNICQSALDNECELLIQTSTSEVYGTARYTPIDEKHPLSPQSPYSASKIGSDSVALSYYLSFGLPVIIARPFNTFGPRQSARAVIPSIIIQLSHNLKEIKLGNLKPKRDFTFVHDTAQALIFLAKCKKAVGETINIGSNSDISVEDLFKQISIIMGSNSTIKPMKERYRPDKSEVFRLLCDHSKLVNLTGFKPKDTLESGLKKTIQWFSNKDHLNQYKSGIYNV